MRNDGNAFMASFEIHASEEDRDVKHTIRVIKLVPKTYQEKKKGLASCPVSP